MKNKYDVKKIIIFMLICAGFLFFEYSKILNCDDIWCHIKTGGLIVSNRSVPSEEVFSWILGENSISWLSHEWLSDVIAYAVHTLGGETGIYIFSLFAALTCFYMAFAAGGKEIRHNILWAGAFSVFYIMMLADFCYLGSQVFVFWLFFAELYILYRFKKNNDSRAIWFLPVIACLWANLQGSSSYFSYLICILFIIAHSFNINFGKICSCKIEIKKLRPLIGTVVLIPVFLCLNPYGINILVYPYANMMDSSLLNLYDQMVSPDAKILSVLICYFVPLVFVVISLFATSREIDAFDMIIFLFTAIMFFRSTYYISLFMIASFFYIFKYTVPYKDITVVKKIVEIKKNKTVMTGVYTFAIICTAAFMIAGVIKLDKVWDDGKIIETSVSEEIIEYVKNDSPSRLFNEYSFGDELIYNDIPVFVDGRGGVYSNEIIRDYSTLVSITYSKKSDYDMQTFVDEIIDYYDFDAILVKKSRSLYAYLVNDTKNRYEVVMDNDEVAYFKEVKKDEVTK